MSKPTTADDLEQAVAELEQAATNLSSLLERFDLSGIPFCEKNLNQVDIGSKIKVAKFLLGVIRQAGK